MPAGPYFSQAVTAIRNAVMELRRDVENKRHTITMKEQEMRKRKEEVTEEKNRKAAAATSGDLNSQQRAELMRQANQDYNQMLQIERKFNEERNKILGEISQADQDIIDLENQARDLEGRQNK